MRKTKRRTRKRKDYMLFTKRNRGWISRTKSTSDLELEYKELQHNLEFWDRDYTPFMKTYDDWGYNYQFLVNLIKVVGSELDKRKEKNKKWFSKKSDVALQTYRDNVSSLKDKVDEASIIRYLKEIDYEIDRRSKEKNEIR